METAIVLILVATVVLLVVMKMLVYLKEWLHTKLDAISEIASVISTSIAAIAESKRLSTILTIEAKKDLDIKPEEFEPKKEELRASMHSVLEEKAESYRRKSGKIGDPNTVAFVVLNHSGFDQFVDSDVRRKAQNALARLIANQDVSGAKRFITTLVRNL